MIFHGVPRTIAFPVDQGRVWLQFGLFLASNGTKLSPVAPFECSTTCVDYGRMTVLGDTPCSFYVCHFLGRVP